MYNFNHTDWPKIKSYLDRVDWESELDTKELDISWMNFKSIFSKIIDKHVPMVNIKTEFKSPWFDSECFQKCKERGGGPTPFLPMGKMCLFPFFPWGKSIWKEREMNTFPSLSIFSHFSPWGKMGKDTFFPWAKMGLDPPQRKGEITQRIQN